MSSNRLKDVYRSYRPVDEAEAERKLLGRTVDQSGPDVHGTTPVTTSFEPTPGQLPATPVPATPLPVSPAQPSLLAPKPTGIGSTPLLPTYPTPTFGLNPRPSVVPPEATTQMSFRIPISLARRFRRTARFNRLEQQEIIADVLRRALTELPSAPPEWQE